MLKPLDSTFELISYQCKICNLNPADFIIPTCLHKFCESCIKSYLSLNITEGQVLNLTCPEQDCCELITQSLINSLVPELSQKFQDFSISKQKESDPNFRWCPKLNCSGFDIKSGSNKLECNKCKFKFCFNCSEAWHKKSCKDLIASNKQIKKCPNCQIFIEKKTGCPEMKCTVCSFRFCWLCSQGLQNHSIKKCFLRSKNSKFYWVLGAILLFFPLTILFWLPMMLFLFIYIDNGYEVYLKRRKLFIFGFTMGFVLSPIIFPLGFLAVLFYCPYEITKSVPKQSKLYMKILYYSLMMPILYLISFIGVLTIISILLTVCPLFGLILLILRITLLFFTYSPNQ